MATLLFILLAVLRLTSFANAVTQLQFSQMDNQVQVNLRIEGSLHTIFEGPVVTSGHNVTTHSSNGTHHCDGTNGGAYMKPGPTATSALDDANATSGFGWDATFSPGLDDFFITRIGDSRNVACQSWGLVVNYKLAQVGGCQVQVQQNDQVLWAFGAFGKGHFLNLTGPSTARQNQSITVTVTDASSGLPIAGACLDTGSPFGAMTDGFGNADVMFSDVGVKSLKAERSDSVRSNTLRVNVTI